jgi:hypothetical protein
MMVASLKDNYPDRAIVYSFLLGILVLGVGFIFSFLVNDDRFIPRRILLQLFAMAPPPDVRLVTPIDAETAGAAGHHIAGNALIAWVYTFTSRSASGCAGQTPSEYG